MKRIHSGGGGGQAPPPTRRASNKGCYDSIQRCQKVPDVYLAIRYHGRPALQKNPVDSNYKNPFFSELERELQEKFDSKELSSRLAILKRALEFLFTILFFPLNFIFNYLPVWLSKRAFPVLQLAYEKVATPIKRFLIVFSMPIHRAWKKATGILQKVRQKIQRDISAVIRKISLLCSPLANTYRKYASSAMEYMKAKLQFSNLLSDQRQKVLSYLQNPFKTIKEKFASGLRKCLNGIYYPFQKTYSLAKVKLDSLLISVKDICQRIHKLFMVVINFAYFIYVWMKIFVRYFIKLSKEVFKEHLENHAPKD